MVGKITSILSAIGDLLIQNGKPGNITKYKRELDLSKAIVYTTFKQDGVAYRREAFASYPNNVIIIHLTSSIKKGIDVLLQFTSPHPTASQLIEKNRLVLRGHAPGYVERRTFKQIELWNDQYKHPELYDKQGNRKFNRRVLYGDDIEKGMFFEAQLQPFGVKIMVK